MSAKGDVVNVRIPQLMYEKLERKILGTRFESVQDYMKAILEHALGEGTGGENNKGLSTEDELQIKERLKALGCV